MVSLVDIADLSKIVPIRGQDIAVTGVSAEGLAHLINEFPEVRSLMAGRGVDLSLEGILSLAPKVLAAIIAAGTGSPGDKAVEAKAGSLGVGEQAELILAILEVTFPQGIQSFAQRLEAFGISLPARVGGNSVQPPRQAADQDGSGRAQDTK
jgi:hypothetical protein